MQALYAEMSERDASCMGGERYAAFVCYIISQ